jgi:hypothetical protein
MAETVAEGVASFADFWPHYLRAHRDPRTRASHYFGLGLAFLCVVLAFGTGNWWLLAAAFAAGYGFAIPSHYLFEGNRPATFGGHPFYSMAGDFRMTGLWLLGRLQPELDRAYRG